MATIQEALATATQHLLTGQSQAAGQLAQQVLAVDPNNPEAEFIIGRVLRAQGADEVALARFERILWLRPVAKWQVIQAAIAYLRARTYVEIGVDKGYCLARVAAPVKIGIDPVAPAPAVEYEVQRGTAIYFRMTSDEFFASPPAVIGSNGIDVAFVDGLHTYRQALADVEHCLKHLNPRGVILMHDCNPPSEVVATPASSFEEAAAMNLQRWASVWTGDVWKTVLHLRAFRKDVRAFVLDCDLGIGVVFPGQPEIAFRNLPEDIGRLVYADLARNRMAFLGLRQPQELLKVLRSRTAGAL